MQPLTHHIPKPLRVAKGGKGNSGKTTVTHENSSLDYSLTGTRVSEYPEEKKEANPSSVVKF
jgi:hypothetical protein